MNREVLCGVCALVLLTIPRLDAAAAELVVIGSTGTEIFAKGDIVDSKRTVQIPEGTSVTFMDVDGKVITVRGPYAAAIGGSEGGKDMGMVKLVSALFNEHPSHPLGAFRGAAGSEQKDPWAVDTSTPGDKCIRAKESATLWQPGMNGPGDLTLTDVAAGKTIKVRWSGDALTAGWPKDLPLQQGAEYEAKLSYQMEPNRFVLHIADKPLPKDSRAIEWLVQAGCYAQAHTLLGMLPADKIIDPANGKG